MDIGWTTKSAVDFIAGNETSIDSVNQSKKKIRDGLNGAHILMLWQTEKHQLSHLKSINFQAILSVLNYSSKSIFTSMRIKTTQNLISSIQE